MNRDVEEKVIKFLKIIAQDDNWKVEDLKGKLYLTWTKEHFDPEYVALDLLNLLEDEQ